MRDKPRAAGWQMLIGLVVYPAVCVLVWLAIDGISSFALGVLALAAPGLAAGFVVRRRWLYAVPVVGYGVALLARYLHDPTCSDCTQDDWVSLTLFTLVFFVAPALLAIAVGRTATTWRHRSSARRSGVTGA